MYIRFCSFPYGTWLGAQNWVMSRRAGGREGTCGDGIFFISENPCKLCKNQPVRRRSQPACISSKGPPPEFAADPPYLARWVGQIVRVGVFFERKIGPATRAGRCLRAIFDTSQRPPVINKLCVCRAACATQFARAHLFGGVATLLHERENWCRAHEWVSADQKLNANWFTQWCAAIFKLLMCHRQSRLTATLKNKFIVWFYGLMYS